MAEQTPLFAIENLRAGIEGKEILRGVNLVIERGEIHALMGPNGSGKSTLAYVIAGHPNYEVYEGRILYKGENILELPPDERARMGLFLAFQYPTAIPGVTMANFLRLAVNSVRKARYGEDKALSPREFRRLLREKLQMLRMEESFASRYLNEGFSGGEKKRAEILQMALLEPEFAVLDETDSGLDIDALRTVSDGVNRLFNPTMALLVITHYQRILNYIRPQFVHVMLDGKIAVSGGPELAEELEEKGYDWVKSRFAEAAS
ncbi:MAG: Fe-S cluster assembly ATPase SufC [Thermomicrobium sp.]|nr:Fe-S cluster assembly ATPase SufC [Thermomicrobium sp.]MDW7982317.1 Fe-S cluster assembly ATPase SufC [Thermomicrobium sp.]